MADAHVGETPIAPPIHSASQSGSWIPIVLISLWLAIEIGRPPHPLKIPLLCSLILGGCWLTAPHKRWDPVVLCIIGFLATGWIGVPLAANQYSAYMASYGLTIVIGCVCLPAAQLMKTMSHIHLYVLTLLTSTAYVGLFAITHAGFGPAGAPGGQDENYVAAAMSAALPFAYFGLSATRKLLARAALMGLTVIYLLATVIGFSRGGFLGMAAAGLFCFWYSPRKLVAVGAAVIGIGAVVAVAPSTYWEEMQSISDTSEGTADMRFEIWTIATRQFLDNPILGVAPGNFIWRIKDYQTRDQTEKYHRSLAGSIVVHSTYFEILAELGSVGMGFFLAMLYFTFRELRRTAAVCQMALGGRRSRRVDRPGDQDLKWARAYALAFQGGLIGYLVCSAFLSTTYFSTIWIMCASSVALRYAVANILRARTRTPATPKRGSALPVSPSSRLDVDPPPDRPRPRLSDLLEGRGQT